MAYDFCRSFVDRVDGAALIVAALRFLHGHGPALPDLLVRLAGAGEPRDGRGAAIDYAREERWAQEVVPSIVVGDPSISPRPRVRRCWPSSPCRRAPPQAAIVIVHGLGVHPDWGLIGGLRTGLADAGYVTLSVQMPVLDANATRDDYAGTLPEAGGPDRRRGRVPARQGRREDRDRLAQHGSVDGQRLPRAADADRRVGADRDVRTRLRRRRKSRCSTSSRKRKSRPSRETAPARVRRCRRTRARASSRSPAPIITSTEQQKELVAAIAAFLGARVRRALPAA